MQDVLNLRDASNVPVRACWPQLQVLAVVWDTALKEDIPFFQQGKHVDQIGQGVPLQANFGVLPYRKCTHTLDPISGLGAPSTNGCGINAMAESKDRVSISSALFYVMIEPITQPQAKVNSFKSAVNTCGSIESRLTGILDGRLHTPIHLSRLAICVYRDAAASLDHLGRGPPKGVAAVAVYSRGNRPPPPLHPRFGYWSPLGAMLVDHYDFEVPWGQPTEAQVFGARFDRVSVSVYFFSMMKYGR